MVRLLISAVLRIAGNAIGLLVAAAVLDDMSVSGSAFVIAVLVFTCVEILALPLLRQIAIANVHAIAGSVALIATFIGLVVTNIVSDGFEIHGFTTWVLATIIVWLVALLAAVLLPLVFLREAAQRAGERRRGR